jgi:WD40 repeat protein
MLTIDNLSGAHITIRHNSWERFRGCAIAGHGQPLESIHGKMLLILKDHFMKPPILFISVYQYTVAGILTIFILLASVTIISAQPYADCSGICDLAWSPVEENLLGAVDEFGLWLVDLNESESDPLFFSHENSASLSFDPTGQYIAVTSCPALAVPTDPCKGSLSLFDLHDQSWTELGAYDYRLDNIKFSPDSNYMAFQIGERSIQLIDLITNETFSITDRILANVITDYTFDPQSNYIALSNGAYGTEGHAFWGISLWRLSDQTLQTRTEGSILALDLTFTETKSNIMFVKDNTEVLVWDYNTGVISSLNKLNETVGDNLNRLSFSYPPTYLLAALLDDWHPGNRTLFVWDIQSSEQIFFLDTPEDSFTDLITINSTGAYLAYSSTVDEGKIVGVWERTTDTHQQIILTD